MMRFILRLLVIPALLICGSRTFAADVVTLAAPDHPTALVIRDGWKQSTWSDWGAHQILAAFFKEVTGVQAPIVKASEVATPEARAKYKTLIWCGRQPEVDRTIGAELDKLDDDGFILHAAGNNIYVAGKKWWGDNWAAHDLLERYAGCRWYGPDKEFWKPEQGIVGLFDVVPKRERIEVPSDAHVVEQPVYKMRFFRFMPLHAFRLRYRDQFHHALVGIIDPRKHGEQHPEWFPLIDGERYVPPPGQEIHFQPCATHPEVEAVVAGAAIDHFKQNPDSSAFSVGMNDTDRFCECDKCIAVAPATITDKQQRLAFAFFDFYNRVAARVEAAGFGDKRLGCLGYAGLSVLPKGSIRMHPMLVPYLTRDSAVLFDPNQQNEFADIVATWNGLAHRMGIYEYMYGGGFVVPRVYNRYLIKNIRDQYGVGCDGFYAESYPNFGLDGPKYWLTARMLWDPRQDPEKLLTAYYADLFGPAAKPVRAYFDFLEETWCTQAIPSDKSNYRWFLDDRQLEIFPPEKCEQAWALLDEAERAAAGADTAVLKRIGYFRDSFAVTRALSARYAATAALDATLEQSKDEPLAAALPARLAKLQAWLDAPDPRPVIDRALAHGTALDTNVIQSRGGFTSFDRQPTDAVAKLINGAVTASLHEQADQSPAAVRERVAKLFETVQPPAAASYVSKLATDTGLLPVRQTATPPSIDGTINSEEWLAPSFTGKFFEVHRLTPQAEETTVYAAQAGGQLLLAFDCKQDPATVGGTATGADTGGWQDAAMRNDDCVSVTFLAPGHGFRSVRINVNGALGFHDAKWDGVVKAAAAKKTADGWHAELALDLATLGLDPSKQNGQWTFAIARYTRRPVPQDDPAAPPKFETQPSTLTPAPPGGNVIGQGNHWQLMTFVSGPRAVFE